jgi:hypothetical protein
MKNLKICRSRSVTALKKLNEAVEENGKKKYVFQGVFTACSTPEKTVINRNNRSYPEREVLKHLSYLRDAIKQQGSLLGELDHPEGRFDIQLKEASHKITDLWYDTKTHCVMGKLELLDTPNGKIAKELVDAGYPLFVSSRAAGDVDEKTHEVEIAQIFTYDIVCTPGFAEARLEKVNESISANAINFVNETIMNDMKNDPYKIALYESDETIKLNEHALASASKPIKLNSLTKPLLEEDEFALPEAETDPTKVDDDDSDKDEKKDDKKDVKDESPKDKKEIDADKDDISEDGEDDEKDEKRSLILNIQGEDKDGEVISADNEASEDESEDTSDMREKILNISAEEVDDSEDEKSDKKKSDDKDSDSEDKEDSDEDIEECNDRKNKVSTETDKTIGELEDLLLSVEKTESVRESIIRRYPFTISLSEDNFGRFAALRPQQKKKCNDFIVEHQIFDIQSINELWATPLQAEKRIQKNWLKLASQRDIDLYVAAPKDVQDAIEESAKYLILETQEDVNRFWQKTGLRQAAARKMQAEKFVNEYKTSNASPYDESLKQSNNLGYSEAFINMIGDLMTD